MLFVWLRSSILSRTKKKKKEREREREKEEAKKGGSSHTKRWHSFHIITWDPDVLKPNNGSVRRKPGAPPHAEERYKGKQYSNQLKTVTQSRLACLAEGRAVEVMGKEGSGGLLVLED